MNEFEDDEDEIIAKQAFEKAMLRLIRRGDTSWADDDCAAVLSAIEDYITIKMAMLMEQMADRIEAASGVRP